MVDNEIDEPEPEPEPELDIIKFVTEDGIVEIAVKERIDFLCDINDHVDGQDYFKSMFPTSKDVFKEKNRDVFNKFLNEEKSSPPASPASPQPKTKKDTRSSLAKDVEKLKKISLKEWNKLIRFKQFDWDDGARTKIIKIRTQGKKFLDWIVETKDIQDGDLGEIEFESVLTLAKNEDWFEARFTKFREEVF